MTEKDLIDRSDLMGDIERERTFEKRLKSFASCFDAHLNDRNDGNDVNVQYYVDTNDQDDLKNMHFTTDHEKMLVDLSLSNSPNKKYI